MLKQAIVWLSAIAIGFVGLNFGLIATAFVVILIAALAIGIPIISARRKNVQPFEGQ